MNANIQRAREIFVTAVSELVPAQWDAYVAQACAGDADLLSWVQQLLRAHAQAGSFLEGPVEVPATIDDPPVREGPGTVLGPYKVLEQIGEGGFGVVFLAEQQQPIRRKVALKILKPGMDTRQIVARFEAERQALALMDHPHIARVFDGGETAEGRPYFVMELVKGIPITAYCDQAQLTPEERLGLFVGVCQAVQHAHQKGVIHRDLKPSNVLVTLHDGVPVVKVIDFGIAKATGQPLTDKTLYTGFAQLVGTPLYMSPEQAELSGLDVDTRSDIYSLGVLLYELLTGTTPFAKERFREVGYDEIRRIIREEEPPRPSTRLSKLGAAVTAVSVQRRSDPKRLRQLCRGELDWIVMKCLEKDRNRRYATANALAMDVERYLRDEPVLACPPSGWYRLRKFARRNKGALLSAALVALVLVAGTAVSIFLAVRAGQAEGLAASRLREVVRERDRARRRLYDARRAQARASRWSRRVGQRFESWKALAEAARLARERGLGEDELLGLRNEAIACLALADVRPEKTWDGWPTGSSHGMAFDADLRRYARSDARGNLSVRRVADDRELARLPGPGSGAEDMLFHPGGDLLAVHYWGRGPGPSTDLCVWDWRRRVPAFRPAFAVTNAFAFSPDGRLALVRFDGTLTLHELPGGREVKRYRLGYAATCLAFHPDGSRLALGSHSRRGIDLLDLASGAVLRTLPTPAPPGRLAWHPDGILVAAACRDGHLALWDPATGRPHASLKGHQADVVFVAFSPDGNTLLSSAWDGTSRLWDPWTGRKLLCLPGIAFPYCRDGLRLVTRAGSRLTLWELAPGRECRTLPWKQTADRRTAASGDISPDGRWLALATYNRVRIWDLDRGKEIALLPGVIPKDAKFHPGGRYLFTSGYGGLYRWPVRAQPGSLRIGPARKLTAPDRPEEISLDRAGRALTVGSLRGGRLILDPGAPAGKVHPLDHMNAIRAATSPDGRWAATGTFHGYGVKVWEVASGKQVRHLIPDERLTNVVFSPDGRWLLTGTETAYLFWEVGSWKRAREIRREDAFGPGPVAFTRDGKVLALAHSRSAVQLLDPATGRAWARLQLPDTERIRWLAFRPDGSQLVIAVEEGVVRVWDLRRIRAQLRAIGLDWDLPPYPPAAAPGDAPPVRVEVDLGELGANRTKK